MVGIFEELHIFPQNLIKNLAQENFKKKALTIYKYRIFVLVYDPSYISFLDVFFKEL